MTALLPFLRRRTAGTSQARLAVAGGAVFGLCWLIPGLASVFPLAFFVMGLALRDATDRRHAMRLGMLIAAARYIVGSHFLLSLLWYSPGALVFYLLAILYSLPFGALEGWGALWIHQRTGLPRLIGLAGTWLLAEKLRTLGDLAFPADLTANGFGGFSPLLGVAPWLGPSSAVILSATAGWLLLRAYEARTSRALALRWAACAAALWACPIAAGVLVSAAGHGATSLRVGIVQPAFSVEDRSRTERLPATWSELRRLTLEAAPGTDLVLWPEAVRPGFVRLQDGRIEDPEVAALARDAGVPILYGAVIVGVDGREQTALYNGAVLMPPDGRVEQWYGKQRLLPFVEKFPFAELFGWDPRARARSGHRPGYLGLLGNFAQGPEPTVFRVGEARIGVMICFENLFPELARTYRLAGANALAVLTNDAWWGHSAFAPWHAGVVAARAAETGLPVLRAANSGISRVVDGSGRGSERIPLFERRTMQSTVRLAGDAKTPFVAAGDWCHPALWLLYLVCAAVRRVRSSGGTESKGEPPRHVAIC